ncbi:hypothetical protein ACEPAH_1670 [Sanghuangporus vaninii]
MVSTREDAKIEVCVCSICMRDGNVDGSYGAYRRIPEHNVHPLRSRAVESVMADSTMEDASKTSTDPVMEASISPDLAMPGSTYAQSSWNRFQQT